MSVEGAPPLYPVPVGARRIPCRECGAAMVFAPGTKPGSKIPLSVESPWAEHDGRGWVVRAPSHFTDCTKPARFSRSSTRKDHDG